MNDLHKYIDLWSGEQIYLYVIIFIFIIWLFLGQDIGINILIAIIIGVFVVSYLNNRSIEMANTLEEIQNDKLEVIKPSLNNICPIQEASVVDFLFSIQDLYAYSPKHYEEMVKSINTFYEKYKLSFVDTKTSHTNYDSMEQYKRDALNALKSMIFSLPDDKKIRDKINIAAIVLDTTMTKYLDQVGYLIDEDIYKSGYNINTKIIDYGAKPFNAYDDIFNIYSYEVY